MLASFVDLSLLKTINLLNLWLHVTPRSLRRLRASQGLIPGPMNLGRFVVSGLCIGPGISQRAAAARSQTVWRCADPALAALCVYWAARKEL